MKVSDKEDVSGPRAATISTNKLDGLKQYKCVLLQFWRLGETTSMCLYSYAPQKFLEEDLSLPL